MIVLKYSSNDYDRKDFNMKEDNVILFEQLN